MEFLTNEKLTIVGSCRNDRLNMAQTAMMMRLTRIFACMIHLPRLWKE